MVEFTIRQPDDFHLHLRQNEILKTVAPYVVPFGRVLAMPNLAPEPILTGAQAKAYRSEIYRAFGELGVECQVLTTIQLTEQTTAEMIFDAHDAGVVAAKAYPKGQTTNSDNGILNYDKLHEPLLAMVDCGMVLCLHGETPRPHTFILDRESKFLPILDNLVFTFPKLKIVLEHVTTKDAVERVRNLPATVAATITAHHLVLTLDGVIGDKISPHNFCKPVAKREEDRDALIKAATSGSGKFFFGSDSAPHLKETKECASGCAGIFSGPVLLPVLAEVFKAHNALDELEKFTSMNGSHFYDLPLNDREVTLVQAPLEVPEHIEGIIPFLAGKQLGWQVKA